MKRDMNLICQILLEVEKSPGFDEAFDLQNLDYASEQITNHVLHLAEANLIKAIDASTSLPDFIPVRLT